jgi:hypothetical protein
MPSIKVNLIRIRSAASQTNLTDGYTQPHHCAFILYAEIYTVEDQGRVVRPLFHIQKFRGSAPKSGYHDSG